MSYTDAHCLARLGVVFFDDQLSMDRSLSGEMFIACWLLVVTYKISSALSKSQRVV